MRAEASIALQFDRVKSSPTRPRDALKRRPIPLPKVNTVVMNPGDNTQALRLGSEAWVAQETADEMRGVIRPHIQEDQTKIGVNKRSLKEILIQREESDTTLPVQQLYDVQILGARTRNLSSNLPERNPPPPQKRPLVFGEVFVEKIQAAARSEAFCRGIRRGRPCISSQASRASRTASATAANGILPPQRVLQMNSHDLPSATSSNTCHTMMRVPLNVGLP